MPGNPLLVQENASDGVTSDRSMVLRSRITQLNPRTDGTANSIGIGTLQNGPPVMWQAVRLSVMSTNGSVVRSETGPQSGDGEMIIKEHTIVFIQATKCNSPPLVLDFYLTEASQASTLRRGALLDMEESELCSIFSMKDYVSQKVFFFFLFSFLERMLSFRSRHVVGPKQGINCVAKHLSSTTEGCKRNNPFIALGRGSLLSANYK